METCSYIKSTRADRLFFLILKISLSGYVQEAQTRICGGGYGKVTGTMVRLRKAKVQPRTGALSLHIPGLGFDTQSHENG